MLGSVQTTLTSISYLIKTILNCFIAVEPTLELRFQRLAQMIPGYSGEVDRLAKVVNELLICLYLQLYTKIYPLLR